MDHIQPFQIEALSIRGRFVRLGETYRRVLHGHDYPPLVARILGEAVVLAGLLSSGLKFQGRFTLQIQADGAISLAVVQVTSEGGLRGYARFDADRVDGLPLDAPLARSMGKGHMAFTVEQKGKTERYQGITELAESSLSDCAGRYFQQSEQIDTATMLVCDGGAVAAGIMLQRLPDQNVILPDEFETADDAWRHGVILMSSLTAPELLDEQLGPESLLYRLYHEEGVRVYNPLPLSHQCRCSRDNIRRTLASFPRSELEELKEQGVITVTCEFCKSDYSFGDKDLVDL